MKRINVIDLDEEEMILVKSSRLSKFIWVLFWVVAAVVLASVLAYRFIQWQIDRDIHVHALESSYVSYSDDLFRGHVKQAVSGWNDNVYELQPVGGYRLLMGQMAQGQYHVFNEEFKGELR